MSTLTLVLAWIGICAILVALSLWWGHLEKKRRNLEHEKWLDIYFAQIRADKAARDRLGKFIPKQFRNPNP